MLCQSFARDNFGTSVFWDVFVGGFGGRGGNAFFALSTGKYTFLWEIGRFMYICIARPSRHSILLALLVGLNCVFARSSNFDLHKHSGRIIPIRTCVRAAFGLWWHLLKRTCRNRRRGALRCLRIRPVFQYTVPHTGDNMRVTTRNCERTLDACFTLDVGVFDCWRPCMHVHASCCKHDHY